jgi:hypothetical protein
MEIPLKNAKSEITGYTLVSPEDFPLLNTFKWYLNSKGYAASTIDNVYWVIHRYIKMNILEEDITPQQKVDHINHKPLDNTRENLRIATDSLNARNKGKKENCSSEFIGVSIMKGGKYLAAIRIGETGKKITAIYDNEIHAAHQYNLWLDEYDIQVAKNKIEIPTDFIQWKSTHSTKELPVGISMTANGKKFKVTISINSKTKEVGRVDTLIEAVEIRKQAEIKKELDVYNTRMALPIQLNEAGLCYFMIKNKQIIVDADLFHDLMKYSWAVSERNYVSGNINDRNVLLSRFVMNYYGDLYVDHINNNPLDNRVCNLRILTPKQNAQNTSSRVGSSSQYLGVFFRKDTKKWRSIIYVKGKNINVGQFDSEIQAAKARDIATKFHYSDIGNLNFPDDN